jgi:ubiquinone/menaquinone biosynthesis C-methylase UbiE
MFLRKAVGGGRDPLPITMSGVRMGERVLQIGVDDPALAGALAAKVGLSGHAALAVVDDDGAQKARSGAEEAATLMDVQVTPLDALPFTEHAFDVVVINSVGGLLTALGAPGRAAALRECHRVLRQGGRVVAIESGARGGLSALLRPSPKPDPAYTEAGGTVAALEGAGFKPVRLLADREGYRFTEGLKT